MSPVNQHGADDKPNVEIDPISCCSDLSANSMKFLLFWKNSIVNIAIDAFQNSCQ